MRISIIVPVYNSGPYLAPCIDSILSQNFTDFELLLIDDGSTDGSGFICDAYAKKDSRVRVFHKENGGVSSARNVGLENAQGEWVYFSDSDDVVRENAFEKMIGLTQNNVDYVMFGYEMFDEDGQCVYRITKQKQCIINRCDALLEMFAPMDLRYQGYLWNKLFKVSAIRKQKLFFAEDIKFNEDRLFNVEYLCHIKGKVAYSLEPVYRYIERTVGAMASLKQQFNPLFITDLIAFVRMRSVLKQNDCKEIMDVHADAMHYSVNRYYDLCQQYDGITINRIYKVEKLFIKGVGIRRYLHYRKTKFIRKINGLCIKS